MARSLRVTRELRTHQRPTKNNLLNESMNFIDSLHFLIIFQTYVKEGKLYRPALSKELTI